MAKITGHSYENCIITLNGAVSRGLVARHLYNEDEINPPSLAQRMKNSRNQFYHPSYNIPETENGRSVVGFTREVTIWPYIGSYYLPDNLVFIPIAAFRECMDKSKNEFTLPSIYSKYTWRVENYRKITRSYNDYTLETLGGYWKCEEVFGDRILNGIKFDGAYNKETAKIIKNEFTTIPHGFDGKELASEWATCFVRDDVQTLRIDVGPAY